MKREGDVTELQVIARTGHPDFLDLPWELPLEQWSSERLVEVERGIGRHVVRFVCYGQSIYALKELPRDLADREYRLLRALAEQSIPVVKAVGVVSPMSPRPRHRSSGSDTAVLITRHLDLSLPYRSLFSEPITDLSNRLLDALVELLVRLHLAGFMWGDCSLSNALFRRDAGALAAYLVDGSRGCARKRPVRPGRARGRPSAASALQPALVRANARGDVRTTRAVPRGGTVAALERHRLRRGRAGAHRGPRRIST
jgi:hypothetical protein